MNKLTQSREIKKKMNKNRNEIKSLKMRMGKKYQKLENNEDQKIQIRPKASNVSNTTKTYVKNVKNNARKHKNHRLWSENIIIPGCAFNVISLLQIAKSIINDSKLLDVDKIYEFSLSHIN